MEVILSLKHIDLLKAKLLNQEHYHFIGLGGIGMSGIALALLKKGYSVSGSDPNKNDRIDELALNGAIIFQNQNKTNIEHIVNKFVEQKLIIVISSAIKKENEELSYCIQRNLCIKHRSEILSNILKLYKSIAVAGSHGKTSTSTLLSTLLQLCTQNTSTIIGGVSPFYKSNSFIQNSKYLVAEIDESDGTTINYSPYLGIINNIDFDHCDFYPNLNQLISSFRQFGLNSQKLLTNFDCKITQNNINSGYQWSIKEIKDINFSLIPKRLNQEFTVADYYEKGNFIETLKIPIPGIHNLSNITAAISACRIIDIELKILIKNIKFLKLPNKRFELRGHIFGRMIIDDYGHHPNEIKATLKLARLFIKNKRDYKKRLVLIFQPHRYSRVNKFLSEFVNELAKADFVIITDIYSAGESNQLNLNSQLIVDKIYKLNKNVRFINNNYEIKEKFFELTDKGDLILNMGAGDCHNLWSLLQNLDV